jgi:hypothetical protein
MSGEEPAGGGEEPNTTEGHSRILGAGASRSPGGKRARSSNRRLPAGVAGLGASWCLSALPLPLTSPAPRLAGGDNLTTFIQAQLEQQAGAANAEGVEADRRSAFFARA